MSVNAIVKKAALAYIGAVAFACEKSKKIIDECVVKGAQTLDEVRPKSEEIIAKVKTAVESHIPHMTAEDKVNAIYGALDDSEREAMKKKLEEGDCGCCED